MKTKRKRKQKLPFSKSTILGVIAFLIISGGWGGYKIVKDNQKYETSFGTRPHEVVKVIDGDTFVATNGATTPDFSDCTWAMHGGTGKYAGVTGGGACIPGGPITKDGNNTKFSWTGEFVLP